MARKYTSHSPTTLTRCQPSKVTTASLKKMFNLYGTAFILSKLDDLDSQDRELALSILNASYITD